LPQKWKESIIVPIHKKGDRMECNNYRGITLLSTSYKILSSILLSRMTPYANEIIGEYQCGFREYNTNVCQLFIDFEKACDSIERESLYDVLIKFGVPKNLVRLIMTCLDRIQSRVGSYLSSSFPTDNGLKQGDALSPLLYNFALEYAIRIVQETNLRLDMNDTHQALAYVYYVNLIMIISEQKNEMQMCY